MKKNLHPTDYRPVVFQDAAAKFAFLTSSTAKSDQTIKWEDGNEYPLVSVHISSASHPFYTGKEKLLDTEGRVDRFKARAGARAAWRSLRKIYCGRCQVLLLLIGRVSTSSTLSPT